jgi:uncharacterized membrane protein
MFASLYEWLKFLHIVAAMVWLGGAVALGLFSILSLRSRRPDAVTRFVGMLRVAGPALFIPPMALVLGLGIWMVVDGGWGFGPTWIKLALVLFAAAFVVGAGFQSRTAILAERAVAAGDPEETARQLRRWSWGMSLILLLLLVVTWDMVFKPGV